MSDDTIDGIDLGDLNLDGLDLGDIGLEELDLDLDAFDLGGLDGFDLPGTVETRYVKPPLYVGKRRAPIHYDNAAKCARDLYPAILAGERRDIWMSGNFIFGDFIEAFAVEANVFIDDLTISTLSMSQDNVDSLRNLLVGDYVGSLNLIVSDYWYSHNRGNLRYVFEQLDIDGRFQLAVAGIHTKHTLLRIGDQRLFWHGSANLRSSRSVEYVACEVNDVLYEGSMVEHRKILDHYAMVKKSVRAIALWNLITGGRHGKWK